MGLSVRSTGDFMVRSAVFSTSQPFPSFPWSVAENRVSATGSRLFDTDESLGRRIWTDSIRLDASALDLARRLGPKPGGSAWLSLLGSVIATRARANAIEYHSCCREAPSATDGPRMPRGRDKVERPSREDSKGACFDALCGVFEGRTKRASREAAGRPRNGRSSCMDEICQFTLFKVSESSNAVVATTGWRSHSQRPLRFVSFRLRYRLRSPGTIGQSEDDGL